MIHELLKLRYLILLFVFIQTLMYGQHTIDIKARFDMPKKLIHIEHHLRYQNTSSDTLKVIYFNDWSNSYSTKTTPLAHRFTEEFSTRFHFAKNEERGFTNITLIKDKNGNELNHTRVKNQLDVFSLELAQP